MAKKKGGGGGGANWMDTYGDMVTLLLCFFVLLYSMSTVDQDKWKALVQSFNPAGIPTNMENIQGGDGPSAEFDEQGGVFDNPDAKDEAQQEINDMLEALKDAISDMIAEEGMESVIQVEMENGKVYIHFSDSVFFLPDDHVLQPSGQQILAKICPLLDEAEDAIDEIRIQGHTAQASPNRANEPRGDYRLSFNRALEVLMFLRENSDIHTARMIPEGFGQWRPVSSNKTAEGRVPNRRVEIIISGVDLDAEKLNEAIQNFITQSDADLGKTQDQ